MFRRVIAGLILGPALLIGSFAWWGFLSLRTVFDESRTPTIAEELLDNEAVVEQIGVNIGRTLEAAMPPSVPLTDEQVDAGVEIILTDPVVRDLIIESLATTHRAFLGLDDAPSTIDLGPALESARERIGIFAPTVAAEIPPTFEVKLPTENIPNASPVKTFLERAVPVLAGVSLVMVLLAFLTTSDRSAVLGKAARWAIGTSAFYLVVGLGLPYLLRRFAPDQAEVLAALLTAVLRAALVPSIVLGGIGAVLLLASMFWPAGGRRRTREPRREPTPAVAARPASAPPPRRASAPAPAPRPRPPAPAPPAAAPPPAADATTAIPASPDAPPLAPPQPQPRPAPRPAAPPPSAVDPTAAHRPTLPTRARPPGSAGPAVPPASAGDVGLPAWTGDADPVAAERGSDEDEKWRAPSWVEGHGWVMDPQDPRQPPNNARFVEGVGWVVPGPPPA